MAGMRERAGLAHGTLTANSGNAGTILLAKITRRSLGLAARGDDQPEPSRP
jgi:hypothetical protein